MPDPNSIQTVSIMEDVPNVGRRLRQPKHSFSTRALPWQIQPFMIAPVLPGDTLERIELRYRAVTDSIKSPLCGWWLEHDFYYVSFSALESTWGETSVTLDDNGIGPFKNLMLSSTANLTGLDEWFNGAGLAFPEHGIVAGVTGMDWLQIAMNVIVAGWFRDEDESVSDGVIDGIHLAKVRGPGGLDWAQSFIRDADVQPIDVVQGDETVPAADPYYEAYQTMRDLRLTELSYDDWLRDQGIRLPKGEKRADGLVLPELLRSTRAWQLPSNSVDPSTGGVASVCYWSDIKEDATKKRFFKEPGFIIGCAVARPKVYLGGYGQPASNALLDNAFAWMPKALRDRPELALRKFAEGDGPIDPAITNGDYWVDVVDLFLYGDQFINFAPTTAAKNVLALPSEAQTLSKAGRHYVTAAMVNSLFTSAADAAVRTGRQWHQDGQVQLRLLSSLRDMT